ncbi:MAG: hypothetical protein ABR562_00990 [Thermoplasmatota archaeon]
MHAGERVGCARALQDLHYGGVAGGATIRRAPALTALSGPAAGVVGARDVAAFTYEAWAAGFAAALREVGAC